MRKTALLIVLVLVAALAVIFIMRRADDASSTTAPAADTVTVGPAADIAKITKRCVVAYSGTVVRDSLAAALSNAYRGVTDPIELMVIRGDRPDTIMTVAPSMASLTSALPAEAVSPITWGQLSQILRGSMVSAQRPPVRDSTIICLVGALPTTPDIVHALNDKDLRILGKKDFDYLKTSTSARFIFVDDATKKPSNTDGDFRMALDAAGIPWSTISFAQQR
jgi:hypothetical protein